MRTIKKLLFVLTVVTTGCFMAGCGDDNVTGQPGKDASSDSPTVEPGDSGPGTDAPITVDPDAGDAGPLDFGSYVVDLIKNHTNDPAPTTNLCDTCPDNRLQSDYASLF